MAAGQGNKIEAQDYNNIYNIINPVLGRNFGGGSVGYDGTPAASQVAANAKISATQWNNLRSDISRCRGHQTGVDLLTNTTVVGGQTPLTFPNPSAQFTATASGTSLTVSAIASGTIQVGSVLSGSNIPANTYTITGQISGTAGSTGTYTVNVPISISVAQTVVSTYYRQISENDRAAYAVMAQAAYDNRIITPPSSIPAARRTTANLVTNQQRLPVANGGGWSSVIRQTITITFPTEASATSPAAGSANTARAYFNSGSQFLFSATFTGSNAQTKNVSWETLCSNMGTIRFGYNSMSDSGSTSSSTATFQSSYVGYTNLPASGTGPSSTQLLYTRTLSYVGSIGNIGTYNPNSISLYGKKVSSGGFDTFTFVFEFNDAAAADTFPISTNPSDTPIDEPVDGTLTTTIQAEYAYSSTGYITVVPPTGSTTGIV